MIFGVGGVGGRGYSVTLDLDLGKKVGKLNSKGGVFCNFGFGLRKKSRKIEFRGGYPVTLDLDLGKKVGKLNSGGGYSVKVMEKENHL